MAPALEKVTRGSPPVPPVAFGNGLQPPVGLLADSPILMGGDRLTISEIMHKAISERVFPGGAVAFGRCSIPCFYQAYGTYTYESSMPVRSCAIFDVASLTKIMATVPAIMLLYDRGLLDLDKPACEYVPAFGANGKQGVTVRMLLTHTAGLREFHPFFVMGLTTAEQVIDFIFKDKLWYPSGGAARYSDLSMIILGLVVEALGKRPLAEFVEREFYKPLGMEQTGFRPLELCDFDPLVVPTEVDLAHRKRLLWGEVHDPTAWLLGGVAGHAGIFSSILDVSRYAQMILSGGMDLRTGRRFFKESTLRLFTTQAPVTAENPRPFALGWDVSARRALDGYTSAGQYLGPRTFGHTGFTGTSLWIDPDKNLFVALLTNSVHPTVMEVTGPKLRYVRPLIADACVHVMEGQPIPWEPVLWQKGGKDPAQLDWKASDLVKEQMNTYSDTESLENSCNEMDSSEESDNEESMDDVEVVLDSRHRKQESFFSRSRRWILKPVTPLVVIGLLVKFLL